MLPRGGPNEAVGRLTRVRQAYVCLQPAKIACCVARRTDSGLSPLPNRDQEAADLALYILPFFINMRRVSFFWLAFGLEAPLPFCPSPNDFANSERALA